MMLLSLSYISCDDEETQEIIPCSPTNESYVFCAGTTC